MYEYRHVHERWAEIHTCTSAAQCRPSQHTWRHEPVSSCPSTLWSPFAVSEPLRASAASCDECLNKQLVSHRVLSILSFKRTWSIIILYWRHTKVATVVYGTLRYLLERHLQVHEQMLKVHERYPKVRERYLLLRNKPAHFLQIVIPMLMLAQCGSTTRYTQDVNT